MAVPVPAAPPLDSTQPCPHGSASRTARSHQRPVAPYRQSADGVWHFYAHDWVKLVLRHEGTQQAGFNAQQVRQMPRGMRSPILYQEGDEHRLQRTQTARFFTPLTTSNRYRGFMEQFAQELIDELVQKRQADLSQLSLRLAVRVAAQVVGLTEKPYDGLSHRIDSFFEQPTRPRGWRDVLQNLTNRVKLFRFYFADVLPAIRRRRQQPQEDVISHLLSRNYNPFEILTECITYGAAGMVTTREFISVAAWHLLGDPQLCQRYLVAGEKERHQILHEILRLEPVVGALFRQTTQDLTLELEGQTLHIPAGSQLALHLSAANTDQTAVGQPADQVCPQRQLAQGVQPYVLSFGDGHHRCPGAYVAIQESDIFLQRLLALPGLRIVNPPHVSWNELVQGYELRRFQIAVGN